MKLTYLMVALFINYQIGYWLGYRVGYKWGKRDQISNAVSTESKRRT